MSKVLALFQSVHQVMKVDRVCIAAKLPIQIVVVPKDISPECGMAIETREENQDALEQICRDQNVTVAFIPRDDANGHVNLLTRSH